jgi:NAD dependent epimerase/dehydratase family
LSFKCAANAAGKALAEGEASPERSLDPGGQKADVSISTILVTGGSGFVGSHVILQLLGAGHTVRTTVRSLKREPSVRAMLRDAMLDIAKVLKARLGDAAKKVPTRQLPDWLVRLAARFDPRMRPLLPLLGNIRNATSAKAERVLGWSRGRARTRSSPPPRAW